MDASDGAMVAAAGFGAFWALVLGAVVALRLLAARASRERSQSAARSRAR
jgi:hypothetical protein